MILFEYNSNFYCSILFIRCVGCFTEGLWWRCQPGRLSKGSRRKRRERENAGTAGGRAYSQSEGSPWAGNQRDWPGIRAAGQSCSGLWLWRGGDRVQDRPTPGGQGLYFLFICSLETRNLEWCGRSEGWGSDFMFPLYFHLIQYLGLKFGSAFLSMETYWLLQVKNRVAGLLPWFKLITVLIFFFIWGGWVGGGDVNVFELLNLSVVAIEILMSDC